MQRYWILTIVLCIGLGGGGFFAGMKYQAGKTARLAANRNGQFARNGARGLGGRNGTNPNGFTAGQIIKKDNNSVTIGLPNNGGSKIILFASSTQIRKSMTASTTDLQIGQNVVATGSPNSDGSITASDIQIR